MVLVCLYPAPPSDEWVISERMEDITEILMTLACRPVLDDVFWIICISFP